MDQGMPRTSVTTTFRISIEILRSPGTRPKIRLNEPPSLPPAHSPVTLSDGGCDAAELYSQRAKFIPRFVTTAPESAVAYPSGVRNALVFSVFISRFIQDLTLTPFEIRVKRGAFFEKKAPLRLKRTSGPVFQDFQPIFSTSAPPVSPAAQPVNSM